ncbi:MAG: ABC transporter permease [Oscillospiraceae bacterium]|nr:ABC transporter permease [Oscillospiraceae bacterium]
MNAFAYGLFLQWKLDIRGKALLITCYAIPLAFFFIMGAVFSAIMPEARYTLIQTMIILSAVMVSAVGLPQLLIETYGSDVKSVYKANGVPLYLGVVTHFISAFIHLMIVSAIMFFLAPIVFDAAPPENLPVFVVSLVSFAIVSLSLGSFLGLTLKDATKLSMVSQIIMLPSMMLSGIMFPVDMLPRALGYVSMIFPATWGNVAMTNNAFELVPFVVLGGMLLVFLVACGGALSKTVKE